MNVFAIDFCPICNKKLVRANSTRTDYRCGMVIDGLSHYNVYPIGLAEKFLVSWMKYNQYYLRNDEEKGITEIATNEYRLLSSIPLITDWDFSNHNEVIQKIETVIFYS